MTSVVPRVALFADSFYEVNGVALTCRQLEEYARERQYPFFSVHTGPRTEAYRQGSVTRYELAPGPMAVPLEKDLWFDWTVWRLARPLRQALQEFSPQVIHVTGPSHVGILGAWLASRLKVPLVASWHTNVHEYAARRFSLFSKELEGAVLSLILQMYKRAVLQFAPNPDLVSMLAKRTGIPCQIMRRGVDCTLFDPQRRTRPAGDGETVFGYVGRLSPEKNVRRLADVERALAAAGIVNYRICVVGHGSEQGYLERTLRRGEFPGVLRGERLAAAYANFDVFLFPSETDTYGNVIQEAMASGVPCVVTNQGGPQYLVNSGEDGFVTGNGGDFCSAAVGLARNPGLRSQFAAAARKTALKASWSAVFDEVYRAYARVSGRIKTDGAPPYGSDGSLASAAGARSGGSSQEDRR